MLELLEQLYLHRIAHLNKFAIRQAVTQVNPDYAIPTKQEISAYMSGQLSLFPKGSGITLIQWQRDKVAFIELFVSVYESNSVKGIDKLEKTLKLTPFRRRKVTPFRRRKLTPQNRCKLTPFHRRKMTPIGSA